jgi:hypothetical protein
VIESMVKAKAKAKAKAKVKARKSPRIPVNPKNCVL